MFRQISNEGEDDEDDSYHSLCIYFVPVTLLNIFPMSYYLIFIGNHKVGIIIIPYLHIQ